MTAKTYHIRRIADLQGVPAERREDCVREILYCIALTELAGVPMTGGIRWTDDGDRSASLYQADGKPFLTMRVKSTEQGE